MDDQITLKGIFERLVALEAKFDLNVSDNKSTLNRFRTYTYVIYSIQIIGALLDIIILYILVNHFAK